MTFDLSTELDPTDTGTHLIQRLKITPRWYISPINVVMWPLLMRRRAQIAMDKMVQNANRLTESPDSESGSTGSA